jgi:putative transcriptional regulator
MSGEKEKKQPLYHYTACGLDNVYLAGGVDFHDGPRGKQVSIRDIDGLHAAIGRFLVTQKRHLSGKEFRFLRHEMLMSQATLANLLDVAEQTVHRWEAGKTEIPSGAEAVIRFLYKEQLDDNVEIKGTLKRIAQLEDEIDQRRLTFVEGGNGWEPRLAKAA